jgi:hypothetical protein
MAAKHIANEQEIVTLREALAEALSLVQSLRHYDERDGE